RDQHLKTVLSQSAGKLRRRRNTCGQADDLFGRLVRVRESNGVGQRPYPSFEKQSFAENILQDWPTDLIDAICTGICDQGWVVVVSESLERDLHARVDHSDALHEPLAIGFNGSFISLAGGEIALP